MAPIPQKTQVQKTLSVSLQKTLISMSQLSMTLIVTLMVTKRVTLIVVTVTLVVTLMVTMMMLSIPLSFSLTILMDHSQSLEMEPLGLHSALTYALDWVNQTTSQCQ